ncbi:MAG: hypothetical protein ACLFWB_03515 [Armatimonadota bacterium]
MSVKQMLSFVPEKPFCKLCYCSNCHGGSQGSGIFSWSVETPDQLTCKYCGMVFPNEKYPLDKTIERKNALGETVTYRYHQDKEREDLRIFIPPENTDLNKFSIFAFNVTFPRKKRPMGVRGF